MFRSVELATGGSESTERKARFRSRRIRFCATIMSLLSLLWPSDLSERARARCLRRSHSGLASDERKLAVNSSGGLPQSASLLRNDKLYRSARERAGPRRSVPDSASELAAYDDRFGISDDERKFAVNRIELSVLCGEDRCRSARERAPRQARGLRLAHGISSESAMMSED